MQGGLKCTGCQGCGVLTAAAATITRSSYTANSQCEWILAPINATSVSLTVYSSDLEKKYDWVAFYQCAHANCTTNFLIGSVAEPISVRPTFTSTTGFMLVAFYSDYVRQSSSGFSVQYTSQVPIPFLILNHFFSELLFVNAESCQLVQALGPLSYTVFENVFRARHLLRLLLLPW
jgi:hypothetical protein